MESESRVPYGIMKQIQPPTTIEQCCYCHFYNAQENNLVVAGTNQLRVFRVHADDSEKCKLECIQTFSLHGNVSCMQSVHLPQSPIDSLLLGFRDAKLCLVQYNPESHDLIALARYNFEDDLDLKKGGFTDLPPPLVRVDPEHRCAVVSIYGRNLVVLPLGAVDDHDHEDDCDDLQARDEERCPDVDHDPYKIKMEEVDDGKISDIIDVQFLNGYYEPTLTVLFHPVRTGSDSRQEFSRMAALSLDLLQRTHATVWSQSGLPSECLQALPVPKPLGGTLVFALNSLFYLNQSMLPLGVGLNSLTRHGAGSLPFKSQAELKITLEDCQACFIQSDQLVMALKNGEVIVLSLTHDGMRCNFRFEKSFSSVLPSCMTVCEDGFLFVGSKLCDSVLLRYSRKKNEIVDIADERPAKKIKLEHEVLSDVDSEVQLEDVDIYGCESLAPSELISYDFQACDSLMNIAPCAKFCAGEQTSEKKSSSSHHDLEMVATSGYGQQGSLTVMQRSIRPRVITTFDLPAEDMFTIMEAKDFKNTRGKRPRAKTGDAETAEEEEESRSHAFLILNRPASTLILQTGQALKEIADSDFHIQGPTVHAASLCNGRFILQILSKSVLLLSGIKKLQDISVDAGSPIIKASVSDPHVVLLSENGSISHLSLKLDASGTSTSLVISKLQLTASSSKIVAVCLYKDVSGMFTTRADLDPNSSSHSKEEEDIKQAFSNVGKEFPATYWLFACRSNGDLEIYSLPDFKMRQLVKNFTASNQVLVDSLKPSDYHLPESTPNSSIPAVQEILVVGMGPRKSRPILFARCDGDISIYESFPFFCSGGDDERLKLRFKKVPHEMNLRDRRSNPKKEKRAGADRLRYFDNIAGYSGVFLCGKHPHWVFMTSRGVLRIHPMDTEQPIVSFAPFHNVNCPNGFLSFTERGELSICVLPAQISYDAPWPVRRVPLNGTPRFINYHMESKTYCVVTSVSEPCAKIAKSSADEIEMEDVERGEGHVFPQMERFSLQLYSPVDWEPVPNTAVAMNEWEHVTTVKNVVLTSEGGSKGYLAVSTAAGHAEDVVNRGRILILDVIEVVPEPGQPLTRHKIKTICEQDPQGPVTELSHVSGFLLTAVGQKLFVWQMKDEGLVSIAFLDSHIYVHQMVAVKNLILIADVFRSVSLLRFQEKSRTLSLVSRDYRKTEVFSAEFFVNSSLLSFVATDSDCNVLVYSYDPENLKSDGGHRLVRKCDFNLGHRVNSMMRIKCETAPYERRHVLYCLTLDGSAHSFLPLSERTYRRLNILQNTLYSCLQPVEGLNSKSYRACTLPRSVLAKCILDGDLLYKYLSLSNSDQRALAYKSASTQDAILEDLYLMNKLTSHF